MAETVIRDAEQADAPRIQTLLEALGADLGKPGYITGDVADLERHGFGEVPRFSALIAERDDEDIGLLLGFFEYSSWRGRPGFYVQDLFVAESARGSGVGRALLARVARRAAAEGCSYLRLSADAANREAQEFYRNAGFRHAEEECIFVLDGAGFGNIAKGEDS